MTRSLLSDTPKLTKFEKRIIAAVCAMMDHYEEHGDPMNSADKLRRQLDYVFLIMEHLRGEHEKEPNSDFR